MYVCTDVIATDDPTVAFKDIDVAIMVGAMPRREGMERKDLLKANAKIFETQGKALDQYAKKTVKVVSFFKKKILASLLGMRLDSFVLQVLIVGNPANTNALLCCKSAPSIPIVNFSCLTRLDQNRAKAQVTFVDVILSGGVHFSSPPDC